MRKVLYSFVLIITVIFCQMNCFASGTKVYVDGNEFNNAIIEYEGKSYISINALINAIGGSVTIGDECVYINYADVTYALMKPDDLPENENDTPNFFNNLKFKVYSNPEYNLVKETRMSHLTNFPMSEFVLIQNNQAYFLLNDSQNRAEGLLYYFDYVWKNDGDNIQINKFNLDKKFFQDNINLGMTLDEVTSIIHYKLASVHKPINNEIFVMEYYLENNSKIKLIFDNTDKILESVQLLTIDDVFIGKIK